MAGISTLATLAQGAWRQHGACRVLTAIDARMGEVYWAEYQRDEDGIWQGEATESVLTPEAALERMQALSGEWYTAGTGWQAWPVLQQGHALQLKDSGVLLPAAEDMLPLAARALAQGQTVLPEQAEPTYLRNEVAWKNCRAADRQRNLLLSGHSKHQPSGECLCQCVVEALPV